MAAVGSEARELFNIKSKLRNGYGEDCCAVDTPYDREDGVSWRNEEDVGMPSSVRVMEAPAEKGCPSTMVLLALIGPLSCAVLTAWASSCWLLSLPGVAWFCVPLCMWAAVEIHKLWLYWDGRVQFVEEWPALMFARTSSVVILFAGTLGVNLFTAVFGFWGFQYWSEHGLCPF